MTALERTQSALRAAELRARSDGSPLRHRDPRATTLVALAYVATVLSVAPSSLPTLLLLGVFPMVGGTLTEVGYATIARRSLYALPLFLLVGAANPVVRRNPMLTVGDVAISQGWVELVAIGVRGVLSVQMALVMIEGTGFYRVCRGLRRMGVPTLLTTQLLMVYRYIGVLIDEALAMERGWASRSYGRCRPSLRLWGMMVGQLLLRSAERARRVHWAMASRGFTGEMPVPPTEASERWDRGDTLLLAASCAAMGVCRLANLNELFGGVG